MTLSSTEGGGTHEENSPWGFWATLGLGVALLVVFVVAQSIAIGMFVGVKVAMGGDLNVVNIASNGLLVSYAMCFCAPVVVAFVALAAWLRGGMPLDEYLGLKRLTWKSALLSVLSLAPLYLVWAAAEKVFHLREIPDFMIEMYRTAGSLPLLYVAVVVAAPVTEELLFRGFLFEGFRRSRIGAVGATLLTSLMWASIHLQYEIAEMSFIFLFGLVLGFVRAKTGSIFAPILAHALSNLISTVVLAHHVHGNA